MQEAPGHCTDAVEDLQGILRPGPVHGPDRDDQAQVAVDLLGRLVGDSPQMSAVATRSTVGFREVCRDRARRTNELVYDRFEWGRHLHCKGESDASGYRSSSNDLEVIVPPPRIAAA
jgi:hypothetical protein